MTEEERAKAKELLKDEKPKKKKMGGRFKK